MKNAQRIMAIAGAAVAGLATSLVLASPASADAVNVATTNRCLSDGTREVTWKVDNSEVDKVATLTSVALAPAGSTVTSVAVGAQVPMGGVLTGIQILPGDTESAHLEVWAQWTDPDGNIKTNSAEHAAIWEGTCTPGYSIKQDCSGMSFTFPALPGGDKVTPVTIDVSLTPSAGDPQTFQRTSGDPEKTVALAGSTGFSVTLAFDDDFKKTYPWDPEGCAVPDLPLTGGKLIRPATIGGGLLVVGAALVAGLYLFRRRRRRRTVAGS